MMWPGTLKRPRTKLPEEVMAVRPYKCRILLAGVLITLGGFGDVDSSVLAAPAKSKKESKPSVVQPRRPDQPVPATLPNVVAKKPARIESGKHMAPESQERTPSDKDPRKIRRHQKAGKKLRPPAVIQPRPNFSYHGILEQPQRYDPSRDRRAGRAPNPRTSELLHDHFQELDKNHDGMIDPFERAFGRLDIDRDLSNRQWE